MNPVERYIRDSVPEALRPQGSPELREDVAMAGAAPTAALRRGDLLALPSPRSRWSLWRVVFPILVAAAIFLADSSTQLQGAVAVLYTAVILLLGDVAERRMVILIGLACAGLTLIAFMAMHLGEAWGDAHARLAVSIAAIAITTWLVARNRSAEAVLREQARILDLTHDTVLICDAAGRICYWNDGAERLYGWSRAEAMGRDCQELLRTVLPVPLAEVRRELLKAGSWSGEVVRQRRDGSKLVLTSRWSVRPNPRDRTMDVIETSADETGKKLAEAEVRISGQRYQLIFNTVGVAICEADWSPVYEMLEVAHAAGEDDLWKYISDNPDILMSAAARSRITEVNETVLELFDVDSRDDLIGRSITDFFTDATLPWFHRSILALHGGVERIEAETEIRGLKGEARDVILRLTMPPGAERWQRVLVTTMDVTERNRMQARLNDMQAELAHAARVATLGELGASIAHEVNQPLSAIVTYGEAGRRWLARGEPDLTEAAKCLNQVVENARRATDVVARIRAMSRKGATEREPLMLSDLVEESLALVQRQMAASRVRIINDGSGTNLRVLGDRVQLQQVLVNLMMNALQAMELNGERPRVLRIALHDAGDGMAEVRVSDTGSGIVPEQAQTLFESFVTTKGDGMGMGLSICRSVVEAHGGSIRIENNPKYGATVSFALPRAMNEDEGVL